MSFWKVDLPVKSFVPEPPARTPEKANLLLPKTPSDVFDAKRFDARSAGAHLRLKLEKRFENKINPRDLQPTEPDTLTGKQLKEQQAEQTVKRFTLEQRKAANDEILHSKDASLWDKLKAWRDNFEVKNDLDKLATESKITDENLAAVERGDKRAIAFFDAMNQTNATGDPWDMNPGDAFRNSLTPEAQKVYDETLAKLRNDPRVQFDFPRGTVDNLAFREIALRGMVAATFGRPQDLEGRLQQAAEHSPNGKFTITFRPDSYVGPDGKTGWGARANRDGIEAKQGFTIQQIANINDNLFIHEFSHTLETNPDGSFNNLPPDFGFINTLRFNAAFSDPKFQQYIGQTEIDVETFPGIQNRFRQDPQGLKNASPEMYKLMVEYSGFDPLTGSLK